MQYDQAMAYPSYDRPFLETWAGRFEAVFVVLHPFVHDPEIDPIKDGYFAHNSLNSPSAQLTLSAAGSGLADLPPSISDALAASTALSSLRHPDTLSEASILLTWGQVAEAAGLGCRAEVARVLLMSIGAYRPSRDDLVLKLTSWCEAAKVLPPSEGQFQRVQYDDFSRLFAGAGIAEIVVQEEFDVDPVVMISAGQLAAERPFRGSLYDERKSLLCVVDWDSHFTLVAGRRTTLTQWVEDFQIDGFFADQSTMHDWWADPTRLN